MAATVKFADLEASADSLSRRVFDQDATLQQVENKIRAHVFALRLRLTESFEDFDKLRTGFMSAAQFRRCISSALVKLVSPLTEQEYAILIKAYDLKKDERIRWTAFVDSIDQVFGAKTLEQSPTKLIPAPHEVVGPVRPLSANSCAIYDEVVARLRSYVKHHGSDVKSWFKDFDKYNNGYITKNQFRRGIPLHLLSDKEEDILMTQYTDFGSGSVNYFKLNNDVNRKVPRKRPDGAHLSLKHDKHHHDSDSIPVGTEEVLYSIVSTPQSDPSQVEEKLKKAVYKDRVRLIEFWKDYDKHHNGLISQAQFHSGLKLAKLPIDDSDVDALISLYKNKQGFVEYKKLCTSVDSIFTTLNLEGNPLAQVQLPPREFLVQHANELTEGEEKRFKEIISRLCNKMAERRLLLAPYFRDFDRVHLGNMGKTSRSQFSRLLSTTGLDVTESDLHILFKKFEDGQNRINYMSFIRAIDPLTYGTVMKSRQEAKDDTKASVPEKRQRTLQELVSDLRFHVSKNRVRVSEYFRDFDKLRSYSIARNDFIRGLNRIGVTLSPEDCNLIADHYADVKRKQSCKWDLFEKDMEAVFGENHLESRPSAKAQPVPVQNTPFVIESTLNPKEEEFLHLTLDKIRQHLKVRQIHVKPFFKDFDKLYTGYVTPSQFRQCLTYAQCNVTDKEHHILTKRWGKYIHGERVCYLLFLQELDKEERLKLELEHSQEKHYDNHSADILDNLMHTPLSAEEAQVLINKIKTKVRTERIRVLDLMADFDRLKHGHITKNEFRRALNVYFVNLNEAELTTLEQKYSSCKDKNAVDYIQFSDDIESVFTVKGLEKNPTQEPEAFTNYVYDSGVKPEAQFLPRSEELILAKALNRLIEKIRHLRLDVLGSLEDYDFINEGTITVNQFRSILTTIGLPLEDEELRVLSTRFGTRIANRINYREFSHALQTVMNKSILAA